MQFGTDLALRATEALTGLALLLQTAEFLALQQPLGPTGIWAFAEQGRDFDWAPAWLRSLLAWLAQPQIFRAHLMVRLAAAITLIIWGGSAVLLLFLLLGGTQILSRWRGAFNGGSDFMTQLLLVGLAIAQFSGLAGLLYIAIHSASSYFISGSVKLLNPEWRRGTALLPFLDDSVYGPLPADNLLRRPGIAPLCCWSFMLWEASAPLALMDLGLTVAFCLVAAIFHLLVFWTLGLNRFFFAWIASFPALLALSERIG
jgi:hypothetical protein